MELSQALGIPETTQKVTTTIGKTRRQQRYEETINLMLNTELSPTKIAEQIGISRKTVYKYWNLWQTTEEATRVRRKWHKLCKYLETENPEEAFRGLTKIVYRMTTEKHEVQATIKEIKLEWKHESNPANPVHTTPETTGIP
jgi:predicted DNA-binding protein YlxM (UPF0122 family)